MHKQTRLEAHLIVYDMDTLLKKIEKLSHKQNIKNA